MDYEDAVKKIQETGMIHLNDLRALKYDDLFEEIKKWCVYANGNVSKLKKSKSKKTKK